MSDDGSGRPAAEPMEAGAWYEAKKKAAEIRNRLFAEDAIRRTLAPQERVLALQDAVARGRDAKNFLSGRFWQESVEPLLRAEAVLKPYNPKADGAFSFLRLVTDYVFGSGQARVIVRLLEQMHRWEKEGDEAEKVLLAEADKRRRAEAARG